MESIDMVGNTHLIISIATILAILAGNDLLGDCEVTNRNTMKLSSPLPKADHSSRELVAGNNRRLHILGDVRAIAPKPLSSSECFCITRTDPHRLHLHQNLSWSWFWHRHFLHAIVLFSMDDDSHHRVRQRHCVNFLCATIMQDLIRQWLEDKCCEGWRGSMYDTTTSVGSSMMLLVAGEVCMILPM